MRERREGLGVRGQIKAPGTEQVGLIIVLLTSFCVCVNVCIHVCVCVAQRLAWILCFLEAVCLVLFFSLGFVCLELFYFYVCVSACALLCVHAHMPHACVAVWKPEVGD